MSTTAPATSVSRANNQAYYRQINIAKLGGDPDVQLSLGQWRLANGDPYSGLRFCQRAAYQDNRNAMYQVAQCYETGQGTAPDLVQALTWHNRCIRSHTPLISGQPDVESLAHTAIERLVQAVFNQARQGHAEAQRTIGFCYENGIGVADCKIRAFACYEKAATQQHLPAICDLGRCLAEGIGARQNRDAALQTYQFAAERGDAIAQRCLALLLPPIASDKAQRLLQAAARGHDAIAQYEYGRRLLALSPDNIRAADEWISGAADKGEPNALFQEGQWCEQGLSPGEGFLEAVSYYQEASEKGHRGATERLLEIFNTTENLRLDPSWRRHVEARMARNSHNPASDDVEMASSIPPLEPSMSSQSPSQPS
ncbi:MAG: sel1 repeat family protein [Chlamydiia bacterium]|nr:sel1 repeat family protein [Chlamydiia bacterium]